MASGSSGGCLSVWPQSDRVIVAASGPSIAAVTPEQVLSAGATVIAVNGAIDWLGRADYWFTLDPSQVNTVRARHRVEGCRYVMALPRIAWCPMGVTRLLRVEGKLFGKARAPGGLSRDHGAINTGNSGFGALNLAYHMRPKKILLLGVDAKQERRVDGGMPRKLDHLPGLFATAVPQLEVAGVEVVNGSPFSAVTCFPRMAPEDGLAWLSA
jgi:hypothetical protein